MMRGLFTICAFVSAVLMPWQFTVLYMLGVSVFEPLAPFAIGIFLDVLYYAPGAHSFPWFSILGIVCTGGAYFLRSRMNTRS